MTLKKNLCVVAAAISFYSSAFAQQRTYSVSNAHAHNDYEHPVPFYTAYKAGFGSIEADIFLYNDGLYVSHDSAHITKQRTLQSLYLDPLQKAVQSHKGHPYADPSKNLILLIDLKTPAEPTLDALLNVLQRYKVITACPNLKIVITGNQPDNSRLTAYPSFLSFDGHLDKTYTADELNRIALFSDDFRNYTKWKGEGRLPDSATLKVQAAITIAHALNKPIRFWAAPDTPNTWSQFMRLNVDYINTDKIQEFAAFLKNQSSKLSAEK